MTPDYIRAIATAVVALAEVCMLMPGQLPLFAYMWDKIASICGYLANMLGWISIQARLNYFAVIQETP